MTGFVSLLVSGAVVGSLYALIACGFVLIYKGTGVFNFAHGSVMMLGTYLFGTIAHRVGAGYVVPVLGSVVAAFAFGLLMERLALRKFIGQPTVSVLMLSIGLSSVLKGLIGLIWGGVEQQVPRLSLAGAFRLGGVDLPYNSLTVLISSAFLFALFVWLYEHTPLGLRLRATASNQDVATLLGIDVPAMSGLAWGMAAVLATVSGILLANWTRVNPEMGLYAFKAFPAAIVGGLDSIPGAMLGGLLIGVSEALAGGYLDPAVGGGIQDTAAYLVLLGVLVVKPYGFFGTEEVRRI